ncbi:MAG: GAD domain-containing protein [Saprospiraceae bacterium]
MKRPQIGAKGLVYVKCNEDGSFKSSVDKFYGQDDLKAWADAMGAKPGDLLFVLSGEIEKPVSNSMNCAWKWAAVWD